MSVTSHTQTQDASIKGLLLNSEAVALRKARKHGRALVVAQEALQVGEQNVAPDHPDVAVSLHNLAELYRAQGNYVAAEPLYKRSLAIREKALGPDHPHVAQVLENLAGLYRDTKRDQEAAVLKQRAAQIRAKKR